MQEEHAKKCGGQHLHHGPLLPYHHAVYDPMHGFHSEINALFDESINQYLAIRPNDSKSIKQLKEQTQAELNARWKKAHLPKFIQWGEDGKGSKFSQMNGPTIRRVFAAPRLVTYTFDLMAKVWDLTPNSTCQHALS